MNFKSHILDAGCGSGNLLKYLSQCGFTNLLGCEPFIEKETVIGDQCKIVRCDFMDMAGEFDLIMLHHTFEHIPDPHAAIEKAAQLLKPQGRLLLRFPNIESIEFRRFRENWWGIHAPRHFNLLSDKGLRIILDKYDFAVDRKFCDSSAAHYLFSTEYSLDIDDRSPLSFRNGKKGLWLKEELVYFERKARRYNKLMVGDWVGYVIKRKNS